MPRWVFYSVLTILLWGVWGALSKPASTLLSGWQVQSFSALGVVPVIALLMFLRKTRPSPGAGRGYALAFGAGFIGSLGNVAYFQMLAGGPRAVAAASLTALYPMVTIVLALVFLGERLSGIQALGAVLSLVAIYCFNVGPEASLYWPWLLLALAPIALWGLSAFVQKLTTFEVSNEMATAAFLLGQLPVSLLSLIFVPVKWSLPLGTWILLVAAGLLLALGNLTLIFAYGTGGKAALVTPLASLYSLVTIPLAFIFFQEAISAREALGIMLALLAVIGLSCAESVARNEKEFSDTMIESMPGVLYFYDERGHFLRWNHNFEVVSGYSAEQIAKMSPLDFFLPQEQALVEDRIRGVFRDGDATVEAFFKARDGAITPYFFTGRRVVYDGAPCLVGVGINISERKKAEQALRESEGKLRVIFEQAPLGIAVIDSHTGEFRTLNPQYCRITGYSEAEMLELDFQRITHPDDLAEDLANMQRLRDDRISAFQMEKRYIRKDGSVVWVTLTCVPLCEEASGQRRHLAMIGDITQRKQAEIRLAQSEQQYRELVELANSIILRWRCDGHITFLNEYGQKFFGYSAQEILGRHVVGTIVSPTDAGGRDLRQLMEEICATPVAFEKSINENVRRNGERVWIAWTNRILKDMEGRGAEILSVGTDITEQRRAEMALRVLNETLEIEVAERTSELEAALVRAEAADRIKSAFLAAMSHELRTPLNSIIGFTGIILQGLTGPLTPEQSKQLGMVRGSARHLLALINDVLDISKIEAGQLEVSAEPFDLPESIERVAASVKPLSDKKGLTLVTEIAPGVGEIVSDRRRMEQILLNLLSNAIKFTDQGGVTLTADVLAEFRSSPAPEETPQPAARVRVSDTGIGIKPEDLATLFQPFRQIDTGLGRQREGTGLGLAICRKLAALMGGDISAASQWSRGSEFTLIIPLKYNPRA